MWNDANLAKVLKGEGVAVMPTDTIYGIVAKAESRRAVERIYELRKRAPEKPCIILIADVSQLEKFSISLTEEQEEKIKEFQEPVSFVLDCVDEKFSYLHRGTKTLAFRLPAQAGLQELLKKTGPLVAPSANLEGELPAQDIGEAMKYFGNQIDVYVDAGRITGKASKIIRFKNDGAIDVLRH